MLPIIKQKFNQVPGRGNLPGKSKKIIKERKRLIKGWQVILRKDIISIKRAWKKRILKIPQPSPHIF